MTTEIDEAFLKRVYTTSAYLWAFGVLVSWIVAVRLNGSGFMAAIGWTLGAVMSAGILWSLEWIIRRAFVPGATEARGALAKFSIVKLFAIAAILSVIIILGGRSFSLILAFCAGVILTQAVIFLKVLGMLICQHSNDSSKE